MAIIELAHITLINGTTSSDPRLLENLREVKRVIEAYSKLKTEFVAQVDDPTVMFVIGAWPDKDTHQHGFDGSEQQASIIALIKDQMTIDWMHYMDVEQARIPLHAPVLAIIKETLPQNVHRTEFSQNFAEATKSFGAARYGAVPAWNIQKDAHEELVHAHFSGWKDEDEATEAFVNLIESADKSKFRTKPKELNFFFTTKVDLGGD